MLKRPQAFIEEPFRRFIDRSLIQNKGDLDGSPVLFDSAVLYLSLLGDHLESGNAVQGLCRSFQRTNPFTSWPVPIIAECPPRSITPSCGPPCLGLAGLRWITELERTRITVNYHAHDLSRHSPDDIQIRGNRTTVPRPRERQPFGSHPTA